MRVSESGRVIRAFASPRLPTSSSRTPHVIPNTSRHPERSEGPPEGSFAPEFGDPSPRSE